MIYISADPSRVDYRCTCGCTRAWVERRNALVGTVILACLTCGARTLTRLVEVQA